MADLDRDSETIARINAVAAQIYESSFVFAAMLREKSSKPTDQLRETETIQNVDLSVSDGKKQPRLP